MAASPLVFPRILAKRRATRHEIRPPERPSHKFNSNTTLKNVSPRTHNTGSAPSASPNYKPKMPCPISTPHPNQQPPQHITPRAAAARPHNAPPARSPTPRLLQTTLLLCQRRTRVWHARHLLHRHLSRPRQPPP